MKGFTVIQVISCNIIFVMYVLANLNHLITVILLKFKSSSSKKKKMLILQRLTIVKHSSDTFLIKKETTREKLKYMLI